MRTMLQPLLGLLLCYMVNSKLHIGTAIYDATGPITDLVFMGMANPSQVGSGLHQRLRARTFVALDDATNKRFAFVSLDAGMGGIVLKNRVVAALQKKLGNEDYTFANIGISGTHTHSGQSGFLQDVMFQFSGSGWVDKVTTAFANGVVESIVMAHNNLQPAQASVAVGTLDKSNINRSPTAYLLNPAEERARYEHDTDHNMTMLKLNGENGKELGHFTWFAVHPTSMNNTNTLLSGDNKGYASYLFERHKNGPTSVNRTGLGPFVAAFPSTNLGDVSPNTAGPRCRDTGEICDAVHSTCNGRSEQCSAFGPGKDMFESCEIIGRQQFEKAVELYAEPGSPVGSTVDFIHTFVKMPGLNVSDPNTGAPLGNLCSAAMGDSFAAGTTDGPGMFDFTQGANSSNPFWHFLVDFVHKSTPEEKACQAPKGILLPTGSISFPWPWASDILPLQILRLGSLVILNVPTEMTTMSGRRFRDALKAELVKGGLMNEDGVVVIAGLSNGYADYTATFEEYQEQRYEAASTIYGPHQLNGYIQEFKKLAQAMAAGKAVDPGEAPKDFSSSLIDTKGDGLKTDYYPSGTKAFGQVMTDALTSYRLGEKVAVKFAGANPWNDLKTQGTYCEIQRCLDAQCSKYETVADDGDWETRTHVAKETVDLIEKAHTWTIEWYIPQQTQPGQYRVVHSHTAYDKPLIGHAKYTPYTGYSRVFSLTA